MRSPSNKVDILVVVTRGHPASWGQEGEAIAVSQVLQLSSPHHPPTPRNDFLPRAPRSKNTIPFLVASMCVGSITGSYQQAPSNKRVVVVAALALLQTCVIQNLRGWVVAPLLSMILKGKSLRLLFHQVQLIGRLFVPQSPCLHKRMFQTQLRRNKVSLGGG